MISKQGRWYVWDSRGGTRCRPQAYQPVNFDLQRNLDEWRAWPGSTITGSIESGRMTYRHGSILVELWREDQPNPTPYTVCDNPDDWR